MDQLSEFTTEVLRGTVGAWWPGNDASTPMDTPQRTDLDDLDNAIGRSNGQASREASVECCSSDEGSLTEKAKQPEIPFLKPALRGKSIIRNTSPDRVILTVDARSDHTRARSTSPLALARAASRKPSTSGVANQVVLELARQRARSLSIE
jgi:hypothetical protein